MPGELLVVCWSEMFAGLIRIKAMWSIPMKIIIEQYFDGPHSDVAIWVNG